MKVRAYLLAASVFAVGTSVAMANDELLKLSKDANQWVMPTGDYNNHRYSQLNQINKDNVKNLRPAWTFSTGVLRGHEGAPLVIGDVMYVHTPFPNNVYALDLKQNARIIWKYEPKQDPSVIPVMCCDTVNRGVAFADGKIILAQADANVVALDAKTGKEVWKANNGDPKKGETMTSAPMIVKDKVIVGISGGEFGVQGHVTAYNLADGKRAWRAYSVGPDDQLLFDASTSRWASRSARTPRSRPGRETSGRSAAARRGAGTPTIRI
jgi:alcohol dehydrogenase (cytochrome c)